MSSQLNVDTIVDKAGSGGSRMLRWLIPLLMYLMVVQLHRILCKGWRRLGFI